MFTRIHSCGLVPQVKAQGSEFWGQGLQFLENPPQDNLDVGHEMASGFQLVPTCSSSVHTEFSRLSSMQD